MPGSTWDASRQENEWFALRVGEWTRLVDRKIKCKFCTSYPVALVFDGPAHSIDFPV